MFPFELGSLVFYNSTGRPYLKNIRGKIISFNTDKTSALVEFDKYREWVGVGSLILASDVTPEVDSIEDQIRKELTSVREEWTKISTEYRRLSTRKNQLENALNALTGNFR